MAAGRVKAVYEKPRLQSHLLPQKPSSAAGRGGHEQVVAKGNGKDLIYIPQAKQRPDTCCTHLKHTLLLTDSFKASESKNSFSDNSRRLQHLFRLTDVHTGMNGSDSLNATEG